jgi:hypothetical protein
MSRAPFLTALISWSAIAAAPISVHFEGNDGTLEPFFVVFPLAAVTAGAGFVIALKALAHGAALANAFAACLAVASWIALVTYEGG